MNKKKLWGGRFTETLTSISEEISESISFDKKLYKHDIQASIAHAKMLNKQNIISDEQFQNIESGLKQIQKEIEEDNFTYDYSLEDIHMHIEKRLTEIIGDDGKRLHTGRSRNDQVAVDVHLYLKEHELEQTNILKELLNTILELAQKNAFSIWAGYTHTQIAQPVYLGHYLMNYFWKFKRDLELLEFAVSESDVSPLGAAAMAGANYNIDRDFTRQELNFSNIYENSMDAVSNRDYQLSYHFFASRLFLHISRFCEDIILYNTAEFKYITMTGQVTTGSSIMPQKKNPDIAELLRGKSARVIGNLNSLLINLKSLPMTYNRDLQEDKIYLFDSIEQVRMGIKGMIEILKNITFQSNNVIHNLEKGFAQATDIADYLVRTYKIPFRETHELTGKLVLYCEENNLRLSDLNEKIIQKIWGEEAKEYKIPADVLLLENCINSKQGCGSTSKKELEVQFTKAKSFLTK